MPPKQAAKIPTLKPRNVLGGGKATLTQSDQEKACCFSVRWNSDASLLACSFGDGSIQIFGRDGGMFADFRTALTDSPMTCLRWGSTLETRKTLIASSVSGHVFHWDVYERKMSNSIFEQGNQIFGCDMSYDGEYFATVGMDRKVRVYDEALRELVLELEGEEKGSGHQNRVFCCKFPFKHRDLVLTGGWDNMVYVWDLRSKMVVRRLPGPHIAGDSIDVWDDTVLTGSGMLEPDEKNLALWDLGTAKCIQQVDWGYVPGYSREQTKVVSVGFSRQDRAGKYFLAGSADKNEARLFDIDGELVARYLLPRMDHHVYSIHCSIGASEAAIGCNDGSVHIVPYVDHLAAAAEPDE